MEKTVILVLVGKRRESAVAVQTVLTKWGCNIKTRLGVHDGVLDRCSEVGLIMLEVVGTADEKRQMAAELTALKGVTCRSVDLALAD